MLAAVRTIITVLSDLFKEFSLSHNLPGCLNSGSVERPAVPQCTVLAHTSGLVLAVLCPLVCLCDAPFPPVIPPLWATVIPVHAPNCPSHHTRAYPFTPCVTSYLLQGGPRSQGALEGTGGLSRAEGQPR